MAKKKDILVEDQVKTKKKTSSQKPVPEKNVLLKPAKKDEKVNKKVSVPVEKTAKKVVKKESIPVTVKVTSETKTVTKKPRVRKPLEQVVEVKPESSRKRISKMPIPPKQNNTVVAEVKPKKIGIFVRIIQYLFGE